MLAGPLIHTCTIQLRAVTGVGNYGSPIHVWSDEQENVACRFIRPKGKAETDVPGEEILADPIVILPPTVTVTEHQRQIVTSESDFAGTYAIKKVRAIAGRAGLHHYECDLTSAEPADIPIMLNGGAPTTIYKTYLDGGAP